MSEVYKMLMRSARMYGLEMKKTKGTAGDDK